METVQPFDTLDIGVLQLDSLNRTVEVNSVGMITLLLAGDFNVVGKTTKQVAADIADRLGRHDLQHPEVTVTLKGPSQQTVPEARGMWRSAPRRRQRIAHRSRGRYIGWRFGISASPPTY